jgi:hypothetical protein
VARGLVVIAASEYPALWSGSLLGLEQHIRPSFTMSEPTELDTVLPAHPERRDILGQFCFVLHFVVMIFILTGWLVPWRALLIAYLVFIPAMCVQWKMNNGACILNNLEGWVRNGRWRNKETKPEEGAWVLHLIAGLTGWRVTALQTDILTFGVLFLVWGLALARLLGKL